MALRQPKDFVIEIHVDRKRQFHYTDLETNTDASVLVLIDGDTVEWVLHGFIFPRTFQIDFGTANPFQLGRTVSLRGNDSIMAPPLNFPFKTYPHNRLMKYTVSLANGWSDDPDIVPAPGDPTLHGDRFLPASKIKWDDATTQVKIVLTQPDMTADATGNGGYAQVTWSWQTDQPNPQPFSLQFSAPAGQNTVPAGWPSAAEDSAIMNGVPAIQLYLPPGYNGEVTPFTVTTTDAGGNQISVSGTLLIT